jgi:hypothetical protein
MKLRKEPCEFFTKKVMLVTVGNIREMRLGPSTLLLVKRMKHIVKRSILADTHKLNIITHLKKILKNFYMINLKLVVEKTLPTLKNVEWLRW